MTPLAEKYREPIATFVPDLKQEAEDNCDEPEDTICTFCTYYMCDTTSGDTRAEEVREAAQELAEYFCREDEDETDSASA